MVSHFTISTGFCRRKPAIIISSRSGGSGGIAADRDGHVHTLGFAAGAHAAIMFRALFMGLPMHAGGALIEHLKPIAAAVALARIGIARKNHRQRDVPAAIFRPALENRE